MINCGKLIILTQFHFLGGFKKSMPVNKEHFFVVVVVFKAHTKEELFFYYSTFLITFPFPVFQRNLRKQLTRYSFRYSYKMQFKKT